MPTSESPSPTQPFRALVVEDDPAIRKLVEKILQRIGIEIELASDANAAKMKIGAAGNAYSVVILDLMLPDGSGFDVIDFIKSSGTNVPVAVVSAVSQQALTKLDLDIVKLVISKPFDVDEFTKAIMGICRDGDGDGAATS
jgi:DNA-binding response OmpR family regulator